MEPELNIDSVFYKQKTPLELEWTDYWVFQTITKINYFILDSERIRFHRNRLFVVMNDNSFTTLHRSVLIYVSVGGSDGACD